MAKADIEGYSKEKQGPGWKSCPQCGGYVRGPNTPVCPACKHEFPKKEKGESSKPGKTSTSAPSGISGEAVLLYVLRAGGIDKAKKGIEGLKSNPCMEFAISCGGVDAALKKLAEVEAKIG